MLLTNLLAENAVKKPLPLSDVQSSVETSSQDLSIKLQFLKEKLNKKQWLLRRRNSEKPLKKRTQLLRRFSFPLLHSKNDTNEEMVTSEKDIESYYCVLCRVHEPASPAKIWKTDKNCCCMAKDDVCDEDIKRVAASLTEKLKSDKFTGQELSDSVQNVYGAVDVRLQNSIWEGDITEEMAYERMNSFEKKLMRNLHCKLFSKILQEEDETDQNLSDKINRLFWVRTQHLAAKINESDIKVTELLHKAMLEIATINVKESPAEKLECIMNCSRHIFAMLKLHPDSTECADDYLPVLVYIVLQVNPSHLHSNIKYILLFSNSDRVVKGEEGYYFTHLCSVVSFIENLNAESLNLSKERFESYISGCRNEQKQMLLNRNLAQCICKVYNETASASALKAKQIRLQERSLSLQNEMKSIKEDILSESTRSITSNAKVSKFMTSRWERSRSDASQFLSHLPGRTSKTERSQGKLINNFYRMKSETKTFLPSHDVDSEKCFDQKKNLNGYCDIIIPGEGHIELSISQEKMESDQIRFCVPKNLLNDSVDAAFDMDSCLLINDLKVR